MSEVATADAASGTDGDPGRSAPLASLIERHDWDATPLGPRSEWSVRLRTAVDIMLGSGHAMCLVWGAKRTLLYNDAYAPFLGARHPRALGTSFAKVWSEIWSDISPSVDRVFTGETTTFQAMPLVLTRNGDAEDTWWDFSFSPVHGEGGQVAGLLGVASDATPRILTERERDEALAALRASESIAQVNIQRVQLALGAGAIIGTWFWDITADRFMIDEPFARAFGLDPALGREGIPLAQIVETVHPDDQAGLADAINEAVARGGAYAHQYRTRRVDGNYYWLEANGRVDHAPDGTPTMFPGVLIDIEGRRGAETERDRIAHDLAVSEARFRALFENIDAGFCICEVRFDEGGRPVDHRVLAANPAFERHTGLADAVGRWANDLAPGIEQHWHDAYGQVARTGEPMRFEGEAAPLGRWYDAHLFPAGGGLVAMLIADTTDRRRAELELRKSEAEAQAASARRKALIDLGDELRNAATDAEMLVKAAEIVGRTLGGNRAGYGELDATASTVMIRHDGAAPGEISIVGRHDFAVYGPFGPDIQRGDPVIVGDVATDPRTSGNIEVFAAINLQAMLNVPVQEHGRTVGLIFVHTPTERSWTSEEVAFARNVADRVQVGIARLRAEEQRNLLNRELSHRMKNSLAMVQAIATQTLRSASTMEEGREAISSRLTALAQAQDILTRTNFEDADIHDVVSAAIAPHQTATGRISWTGPHTILTAQQAMGLALAIHELATNAAKYGALSNETGRVALSWCEADGAFAFEWIETDGPPVVPPQRRGFGSKLIERIVGSYFDGEGRIDFDPAGIRFQLTGTSDRPVLAA